MSADKIHLPFLLARHEPYYLLQVQFARGEYGNVLHRLDFLGIHKLAKPASERASSMRQSRYVIEEFIQSYK